MRLVPALLVLSTGVAAASPQLSPTGELTIDGEHPAKVQVRIKRGTVTMETVRGTPTILVRGDAEAVVLQLAGSAWKEVTRTAVGGVGLDADYGIDIALTPDGIFWYETRPEFRRCDDKPALLFGERFEGGKFRRLARLPTGVPEAAPVIAARRETSQAAMPLLYKAKFASHQIGASDAGSLGVPRELDDGKLDTVWREELVLSSGEGQFFTYMPRPGATAEQIRIVAADVKDANRVQRIGVVSKGGAWHVELPADSAKDRAGTAYVADLPAPVEGCVTLVIESTFGPDKGTTALAELEVFAHGELAAGGGEAALAKVIADGSDGAQGAMQVLAERGAAAVMALEAGLARAKDAGARHRLVVALGATRDPNAAAVFAKLALDGKLEDADLDRAIRGMRGFGQEQALHDLAAKTSVPLSARIVAVETLDGANDKERDRLVDLAGNGPRKLREAVIGQLSHATVQQLIPAAQTAQKPAAAGDIWRAITRRAHLAQAERPDALTAMLAALPGASDYERRYRLVDGIAAFGDAAALRTLTGALAGFTANAETSAFKQIAARAISTHPRVEATDLLVTLTHDADPAVRLAALSAIAGATGTPAGPWHGNAGGNGIDRVIVTMLSSDTWPEVRRSAAQVLGNRCESPGPAAALGDAVARDPDEGVRGDALAALVQCHAASAPALLAKLWDDSRAAIQLRQRAVDLTAQLGDRALSAKLVARFTKWRGDAIESEAALALAQSAAYAIGSTSAPGAAEALAAALDDSAFPEIVAAAATGLGLLGPACPASARKQLEALRDSDEQQVQIAARRAATVCGKR